MKRNLPADCALLLGIPLAIDEFAADLSAENDREYARAFCGRLASIEMAWGRYRDAVARPALDAARTAAEFGVSVCRSASLADLRRAISKSAVVTIVAHCRRPGFTSSFLESSPAIASSLRGCACDACAFLRSGLALRELSVESDPAAIAPELNRILESELIVPDPPMEGVTWVVSEEPALHRNWAVLQELHPEWSLRPAGMELADGVCPISRLTALFRPDPCITLDLRLCNSSILGEEVKRVARCTTVMMNRRPATPAIQLPLYARTIAMLSSGEYDYIGAAIVLRDAVARRLGAIHESVGCAR
jgi:hypothetical protein